MSTFARRSARLLGVLLAVALPAAAGNKGWTKFNGSEAGTILISTGTGGVETLTAVGAGWGPHWRAWTAQLDLVYDPLLGQQPGTWWLNFDDGALYGSAGPRYALAGDHTWVLWVLGGTGEYAGSAGYLYWFGSFPAGGGAYMANLYGYVVR